MIFVERAPAAPLNRSVRSLWYSRAAEIAGGRERILPNGSVQIIVNLGRDFILDCGAEDAARKMPASLIVGARSNYGIVDRSDMADVAGIVFEPGGFAAFVRDRADLFSGHNVSLEDVIGPVARGFRDRLREAGPEARLRVLEGFLRAALARGVTRHPVVDFALERFGSSACMASVQEVARQTGWSLRRFSQIFREQVGLSPKVWCRVQRFQRTVRELHAGTEVAWAELALDCGFYDQSHFANEFRAFSGIDATTYSARRTQWANHVAV